MRKIDVELKSLVQDGEPKVRFLMRLLKSMILDWADGLQWSNHFERCCWAASLPKGHTEESEDLTDLS